MFYGVKNGWFYFFLHKFGVKKNKIFVVKKCKNFDVKKLWKNINIGVKKHIFWCKNGKINIFWYKFFALFYTKKCVFNRLLISDESIFVLNFRYKHRFSIFRPDWFEKKDSRDSFSSDDENEYEDRAVAIHPPKQSFVQTAFKVHFKNSIVEFYRFFLPDLDFWKF